MMRRAYSQIVIGLAFAFSILVYARLPDRIPVHWNWEGQVDRYGGRLEGAFLLPCVALGIWLLLRFLPRIDPRRDNYEKFASTYDLMVNGVITLMALIHVLVLGSALGWPVPLGRVVPAAAGVLLLLVGNVMPRARSNWWFGIRTPWTLSNERVWQRTHRLAGYMLMGAGLLMLVSAAVATKWSANVAIVSVVGAAAVSFVYSFIIWRQEQSK